MLNVGAVPVMFEGQILETVTRISEGTLNVGTVAGVTLRGQILSAVTTISEAMLSVATISAVTLEGQDLSALVTITKATLSIGTIPTVEFRGQILETAATITRGRLSASFIPSITLHGQLLNSVIRITPGTLDIGEAPETEEEVIAKRNSSQVRGIKTQAFPQPPQVDETQLEDLEDIILATQEIVRWISSIPVYDSELKENISRSFLSTGSYIDNLKVGLLTAEEFRGQLVYIGSTNQFEINGPSGLIRLKDDQDPPVVRLEMGKFGAGGAAGLKVWDSNGHLIFDLTGTTADFSIGENSITTDQLQNAAVTAEKLGEFAVTFGKIALGAVTAEELAAGSVVTEALATGAITSVKIANNTITAPLIAANTILAGNIASNAVIARHILARTITANKIQVGVIPENFSDLSGEITDAQVADGIPRNFSDMEGLIGEADIAAGVIIASKIGAGAILSSKIAANAIIAGKIAAGTISANHMAANSINLGSAVVTGTLTADHISADVINARSVWTGSQVVNQVNLSNPELPGNNLEYSYNAYFVFTSAGLLNSGPPGTNYRVLGRVPVLQISPVQETVLITVYWKLSNGNFQFYKTGDSGSVSITAIMGVNWPGDSVPGTVADPVEPTDSMPSLTNPGTQNWILNTSESLTVSVSGGDTPLSYTWTESISGVFGSGLTLSGTPTVNGTYSVTLEVEDDDGDTDSISFSIVVSTTPVTQTVTEYIYRRGTSPYSSPSGGTSTYLHTPTSWSRTNPGPTTTEDVYRASRVATYNGTPSSSTFQSATSWDASSTPFEVRTGTQSVPAVPSPERLGTLFVWSAVSGATRYEYIYTNFLDEDTYTGQVTGLNVNVPFVATDTFRLRACNDNGCSSYSSGV